MNKIASIITTSLLAAAPLATVATPAHAATPSSLDCRTSTEAGCVAKRGVIVKPNGQRVKVSERFARHLLNGARQCRQEDSSACVWRANTRGNGIGRSFVTTPNGRVVYVTHRFAGRLVASD